MATFRSGFKIIGELTLRQTFGRVRSFSEDRKPGSWLPEDQWAVRPPCTTCPDPCTPKKPPKPSKSWLSICKDPEPPLPCDIRHNNCPPPTKCDEPWYAFITKKKPEKPKPPLNACRLEAQREAENPTEEYCEDMEDRTWPECYEQIEPPEPVCPERPPAPVIRLSCPPPKDLDLMLWCGRPGITVARIASQCQSDRMPYEEFRPRKSWKPPPFSLPAKNEALPHQPFSCNIGRTPLSEYKQVDIPKPLYTRYKSVELEDENFLLCMTDARCPNETHTPSLAIQPPPLQKPQPSPEKSKSTTPCPEKPVLVAASRKPVKLKCAPEFKFRPKPTKLVERRHYRNPCAQHNTCDLTNINPLPEFNASTFDSAPPCEEEVPKVITGTLTNEPQTYQRDSPSKKPPHWMFMLSKPGSKDTPLVPHSNPYPPEPDWSGETDGLKFYDGQDEGIYPKPPPDPCRRVANTPDEKPPPLPPCPPPPPEAPPARQEKFVLMPENYNIRNMRPKEEITEKHLEEASFQEFIDAKTANVRTCSKLYPQMKENILYDLARNCPLPPFDPTKADPPPRRPPEPECPQPMRFYYRRYSTFGPLHLRKPNYAKVLNRMNSDDYNEKCKPRRLIPKQKDCPPTTKGPSCNETELPCCPKAKIPPRCDLKRPLPPCKKRLAPKPSYSECSKDPPPCPRITECNAWEKREIENQRKGPSKGRRFSNWAHDQENLSEGNGSLEFKAASDYPRGFTAPGPSFSEYLDLKDRGQSLNKNIRSSHKQRKVFSGKELMLNFVNPTEDTNSYYKPDKLVKRGKPQWRKLKKARSKTKKSDTSVGNQAHERKVIDALLQDHHTRNDVRLKAPRFSETECSLALSASAEEGTPKAIMGSIGSWINGLIKAQRNRSESCPPTFGRMNKVPATTYVETVDVDRIMKLTKPFEHKLKSRSYENLCYHPVDSGIQDQKKIPSPFRRVWGRHRNRSLTVFPKLRRERARSSLWKFESLSPGCDLTLNANPDRFNFGKMVRNSVGDCSIQGLMEKKDFISKLDMRRLEEDSPPTVENLGQTLLLNVKRTSLDNQPSLMNLSSKNSLRCYRVGKSTNNYLNATDLNKVGNEDLTVRRTISRFSVTSRGASTFSKLQKPKSLAHLKRTEANASTDVVQNLVKKVKVSRPPPQKKDEAELMVQNKTKFRQSATSSMVASVIAKKESDSGKLIQYTVNNKAVMPLALPNKTWVYLDKAPDPNMKYDFRKAVAHATVMKNKPKKWFQDVDDFPNDTRSFFYGGKKKKSGENLLKDDLKYCFDKYIKRQEVRNMLSKLELRKNVLQVAEKTLKQRQKEQTRKDIVNILDQYSSSTNSDKVSGRFSWQHALFKNNKQTPSKNVIDFAVEPANMHQIKSLIDIKEEGAKVLNPTLTEAETPKKLTNNVELYDPDVDVVQCVQLYDKPNVENSKKPNAKDVRSKKSSDTNDTKVKNNRLIGSFTYEKAAAVETRPMTSAVARPKSNNPKCLHAGFHTRRYTKNSHDGKKPSSDDCGCKKSEDAKNSEKGKGKDCECSSKHGMKFEKRTNQKNKPEDADDFSCRIDKAKKPGPNCPDALHELEECLTEGTNYNHLVPVDNPVLTPGSSSAFHLLQAPMVYRVAK